MEYWLSFINKHLIELIGISCIAIWIIGYAVRTIRDVFTGEDDL